MAANMKDLAKRILNLDHSDSQWQEIKNEFEKLALSATEDDLQEFAESGAGEALYMATSAN